MSSEGPAAENRFPLREVTDAMTMRAMAHPMRLRLLALLMAQGPLTATEAGELVNESAANCSFHLRTLAKYGFVEEASGGTGRRRPWRVVPQRTAVHRDDLDAEGLLASHSLSRSLRALAAEEQAAWSAARSGFPKTWRTAAFENHSAVAVTAPELRQIRDGIEALLAPFESRIADPSRRPAGALPVMFTAAGIPMGAPPAAEGDR